MVGMASAGIFVKGGVKDIRNVLNGITITPRLCKLVFSYWYITKLPFKDKRRISDKSRELKFEQLIIRFIALLFSIYLLVSFILCDCGVSHFPHLEVQQAKNSW